MNDILTYEYRKGVERVSPCQDEVKSWSFPGDEKDEATLAHFLAVVASKNGLNQNDLMHLFPAVLRMLRSESVWAGNKKPEEPINVEERE